MSAGVLLLGAGKIGRMIARLLQDAGGYSLRVADKDPVSLKRLQERVGITDGVALDTMSPHDLKAAMEGCSVVISALDFRSNVAVAEAALVSGLSYFDLTEDRETTDRVRDIAAGAKPGQVFVPQCGLAPGFVSILTSDLTRWFEQLDTVKMRVGALPQFPTNALTYNLTWSTDGLINEYCNPCEVIRDGRRMEALPMEGLEHFSLDGVRYEAFNTSGGLGTLCETLDGQARLVDYKTIRYPGHHELMSFLLVDLRLESRRELLKEVFEAAIPVTFQDVVIVFCTITGRRKGQFVQKSELRKIYSAMIGGEVWSAIQVTTAASVCAVMDLHLSGKLSGTGFIRQEEIELSAFLNNRFGRWYRQEKSSTDNADADPME
jgi:saccharopine dehydrogenase-like NADP-dependent oxidoreductase